MRRVDGAREASGGVLPPSGLPFASRPGPYVRGRETAREAALFRSGSARGQILSAGGVLYRDIDQHLARAAAQSRTIHR